MNTKNIILIVVILLIGLLVILFTKPGDTSEGTQREAGDITIEGRQVCLPHRDTSGPVTLECAFGLETSDGEFFALNVENLSPDVSMNFPSETPVRVTGVFTPVDDLSSDDSLRIYNIEGVIAVEAIEAIGSGGVADHIMPPGNVGFSVLNGFGLAVSEEQVLVSGVIPPCSENFDYCIYFNGNEYENTNFVNAGVRIVRRADLTEESQCVSAMPDGYSELNPTFNEASNYVTSKFSPLSDAATGHVSEGELYRLYHLGTCYEFETRVGKAQFSNFPEGEVEEFTAEDQTSLENRLKGVLNTLTIVQTGEQVQFPE